MVLFTVVEQSFFVKESISDARNQDPTNVSNDP